MYCCGDPTTRSNELGPIWYLQPKLGFRRNSFMSLRPPRPACLAHVLRGQLTKFTRNNPGDSQSQCKLKPQRDFTCTNRLITYLSLITDSHSDSQNSSSLGNRKIHQFLVLATCLLAKDLIPASSNLPCFCKRKAKLFTKVSV